MGLVTKKVDIKRKQKKLVSKKNNVVKEMRELVAKIRSKSNDTDIVFIGYLPLIADRECLNQEEMSSSRYVDLVHRVANQAMREVANNMGYTYIDLEDMKYNMCNQDETYVRIPGTTLGTNWHTTPKGHYEIAKRISKEMKGVGIKKDFDFSKIKSIKLTNDHRNNNPNATTYHDQKETVTTIMTVTTTVTTTSFIEKEPQTLPPEPLPGVQLEPRENPMVPENSNESPVSTIGNDQQ